MTRHPAGRARGADERHRGGPKPARDRRWAASLALCAAVAVGVMVRPLPPAGEDPGIGTVAGTLAVAGVAKPAGVSVVPGNAGKLYADFRRIGYRLEDVRRGSGRVPRVFVAAIPHDIRDVASVTVRKAVFIKSMLPLILRVNEELRQRRDRIKALLARTAEGRRLDPGDGAWLDAQYRRHGLEPGQAELLLRRVDVIPPSLVLAQAVEESGWGTSRFALEGRALFGQRTFPSAPGLVPAAKGPEAGFRIKAFDHLLEGVRSYARNLNTHAAYLEFRKLRARMRAGSDGPGGLDPLRLAEALEDYSERRGQYVETLKAIIRVNGLRELDGARLKEAPQAPLAEFGA